MGQEQVKEPFLQPHSNPPHSTAPLAAAHPKCVALYLSGSSLSPFPPPIYFPTHSPSGTSSIPTNPTLPPTLTTQHRLEADGLAAMMNWAKVRS